MLCCAHSLKAVLERQDNRQGKISFIDISDPYYDPLAVSSWVLRVACCRLQSRSTPVVGRAARGFG